MLKFKIVYEEDDKTLGNDEYSGLFCLLWLRFVRLVLSQVCS